jgi:hypothetical protein
VSDQVEALKADLDLGHGYSANWIVEKVDDEEKKVGLLLMHQCGLSPLFWEHVGENRPLFEAQNVEPLFLLPHVACPTCGDKGWLRSDRWVPYDDRPDFNAIEAMAEQIAHEFRHFARAEPEAWRLAAEGCLLRMQAAGWEVARSE